MVDLELMSEWLSDSATVVFISWGHEIKYSYWNTSERPLLPIVTMATLKECFELRSVVFHMQHKSGRAPELAPERAHGRRGFEFWGRRRGTSGRGRTGKERKGPHIHVTGGNRRRNTGQCLIPKIVCSPVPPHLSEKLSYFFKRHFLFLILSEGSLSSGLQPAEEGWQCHTTAAQLPVKTRHTRKEQLLTKKEEQQGSFIFDEGGRTPVHKASGQKHGAIVLQRRTSGNRSTQLISLRGSLQREPVAAAAAAAAALLQ